MSLGKVEALWASSVYSPVPVRNAFEVTVERLAQSIRLGVLVGGDRLPPERELADTLGASRVTLREAIGALRAGGLIESRRGRGGGTFVVSPRTARPRQVGRSRPAAVSGLNDLLDLRRIVEPGAASLAATRTLSAADRATLQRCLRESASCSANRRRLADSRLHMAIAATSESASVVAVVADVQLRLTEVLRRIPVMPANIDHSDRQHAPVPTAIPPGEADVACLAMEEHVDASAALLRGLLG